MKESVRSQQKGFNFISIRKTFEPAVERSFEDFANLIISVLFPW